MIELNGKHTNAKIFTDNVEAEAIGQILGLCNHPAFEGAKIRVMPDVHAGAGCTIGTTVVLDKKMVIPNIVGVDIGCGVLTTLFELDGEIDFKSLDDFINANIPYGMSVRETEHKKLNPVTKSKVLDIVRDLNLGSEERHLNSIGSLGGGNHYIGATRS